MGDVVGQTESCKCILLVMAKGLIHTKMLMANKRESMCVSTELNMCYHWWGFSRKRGKHRYRGDGCMRQRKRGRERQKSSPSPSLAQ